MPSLEKALAAADALAEHVSATESRRADDAIGAATAAAGAVGQRVADLEAALEGLAATMKTFTYDAEGGDTSSWSACCSTDDPPPMKDIELHIDDNVQGSPERGRHHRKKHLHRPRSASNTRRAEIRDEVERSVPRP